MQIPNLDFQLHTLLSAHFSAPFQAKQLQLFALHAAHACTYPSFSSNSSLSEPSQIHYQGRNQKWEQNVSFVRTKKKKKQFYKAI